MALSKGLEPEYRAELHQRTPSPGEVTTAVEFTRRTSELQQQLQAEREKSEDLNRVVERICGLSQKKKNSYYPNKRMSARPHKPAPSSQPSPQEKPVLSSRDSLLPVDIDVKFA